MIDVRERFPFKANVRDGTGVVLAGHAITWSSSTPGVAAVSSTGEVTGLAPGNATIVAMSDGASATQLVQVVDLKLTPFELAVQVTDEGGSPLSGAAIEDIYYGARPAGCGTCNIPYGSFVVGTTDRAGSFVGRFIAAPEAMDGFARARHAFVYAKAARANYETDRRFVVGDSHSFSHDVRLHPIRRVTAGDSASFSIASTDPLFQEVRTAIPTVSTTFCRTIDIVAPVDGVLSVSAIPVRSDRSAPYVELVKDDMQLYASGTGTASKAVRSGEVVQVRIATTIQSGEPAEPFVLRTAMR